MDKVTAITLMNDFYGQLLTERQQKFMELYYGNDYSLGEIAEGFQVSRQAVHDTLKRTENMLRNYEEKLRLVERYLIRQRKLSEAAQILEACPDNSSRQLIRVSRILRELLEMDRG